MWTSWYELPPNLRPEAGLLAIRKGLGLFANLRPSYLYPELKQACPLKESIADAGFDMIIVRELYRRALLWRKRNQRNRRSYDCKGYSDLYRERDPQNRCESIRYCHEEKKKVTSVDKRRTGFFQTLEKDCCRVAKDYPVSNRGRHAR